MSRRITFGGLKEMGKRSPSRNPGAAAWSNPAACRSQRKDYWVEEIRKILTGGNAVILDTETTGLKGDVRVIELSIIGLDGAILFSSLFQPGIPLPERIPELTGITDEMLQGAPAFFECLTEILDAIGSREIIAWNADFDREWFTAELIRAGAQPIPSVRWIDAMELYAYASGRQRKWCKLIAAKEEMGVGESQEHRAAADCLDTLAVLMRMAGIDTAARKGEADLFSGAEGIEENMEEEAE